MKKILAVCALASVSLTSCLFFKEEKSVSKYSKFHFNDVWECDIHTGLLVFPDEITSSMSNVSYLHRHKTTLFDTFGEIFLQYTLPEDEYNAEIHRLENISVLITNENGESATNAIRVDETHYSSKTYVAAENFWSEYEYAIAEDLTHTISCVYIAYLSYDESKIDKKYLRSDMDQIIEEFSIYSHSFDGGNSYYNIGLSDFVRD